ncbi:MAG: DUF4372 domain-containing protein [Bacteroidales bacterium]|nr:DUF4372 domain-containing protein [Bacteroidales bacterium]
MNAGKYVFAKVLSLENRYKIQKCVKRYNCDYRTYGLNYWNQFAQLFFGLLTGRHGLRNICLCLNAHKNNLNHLGINQSVNQSTISRAIGNHSRGAVKMHTIIDLRVSIPIFINITDGMYHTT